MAWNRKGSFAALALALLFVACGDDNSNGADIPEKLDIVASVDDLDDCINEFEGDTVFVKDERTDYICLDGKWTPIADEESSSSKAKSSSSEKSVSSSSKNKSSSSEKVSSSSEKEVSSSAKEVSSSSSDEDFEKMIDPRDGQAYRIVTIAPKETDYFEVWMAQNLNYKTGNSYCYDDKASNCTKYGRLYDWDAARKACPEGWRLPSYEDWENLLTAIGGDSKAGLRLKSVSGWEYDNVDGSGTDVYRFNVLPAGVRAKQGEYAGMFTHAYFWASTTQTRHPVAHMFFQQRSNQAYVAGGDIGPAYSIRCLQKKDDVNHSPKAMGYEAEVSEDIAVGSEICDGLFVFCGVVASDEDGDGLTYSIVSGNTGDVFAIDSSTGRITLVKELDYEQVTNYILDVNVVDEVGNVATAKVEIEVTNVNESSPVAQDAECEVLEGTREFLSGCHVIASDSDGDGLSYGINRGNENQTFSINYEGDISVRNVPSFDEQKEFKLQVNVFDGATFGFANVHVSVIPCRGSTEGLVVTTQNETIMRCNLGVWSVFPKDSIGIDRCQNVTYDVASQICDSRDGNVYNIISIENEEQNYSEVWMAENLNYIVADSYCYGEIVDNCARYGRLYTWMSAVGKDDDDCGMGKQCSLLTDEKVQGVCPSGWHLPSKTEWENFIAMLGGRKTAGKALKSKDGWREGVGDDIYGFTALPAGYRGEEDAYNGECYGEGDDAGFWSSVESSRFAANYVSLESNNDWAVLTAGNKGIGYSIRCIQDK